MLGVRFAPERLQTLDLGDCGPLIASTWDTILRARATLSDPAERLKYNEQVGKHRAQTRTYRLFFHDTHHRSLTDRRNIARYDLQHYDGVLAFGEVIRELYLAKSWAQHAVEASIDWVPNSRFAAFLLGGFNSHVTHHLFPTVSAAHYLTLTPIVQAAARKHGLKYTETTFPGVIRAHFRMLRLMGQAPALRPAPRLSAQPAGVPA